MITTTPDELYESVKIRGGLTRRLKFEQFVNDLRAAAGTHAQPVFDEEGEPVSGFTPTIPCSPSTLPCAPSRPARGSK